MARLLGLAAQILVPEGTAEARIAAIAGEGADVEIVRGSYDEAVELAAARADEHHLVISDTSWPGYEDVPAWVADGYATIFEELAEQVVDVPALVVVQIGVGALALAAGQRSRCRSASSWASSRATPRACSPPSARARSSSSRARTAR